MIGSGLTMSPLIKFGLSQFLAYLKINNLQHTNNYDFVIIVIVSTIQHSYSIKLKL